MGALNCEAHDTPNEARKPTGTEGFTEFSVRLSKQRQKAIIHHNTKPVYTLIRMRPLNRLIAKHLFINILCSIK